VQWIEQEFTEGQFSRRTLVIASEVLDAAHSFDVLPEIGLQIRAWQVTAHLKTVGWQAIPQRVRIEGSNGVTVWTKDPRLMNLTGEFLAAKFLADQKQR
jgi:hypothetical protein